MELLKSGKNSDLKKLLLLDVGGTFIKCSDGREIPVDSDGPREEIASAFREAAGVFCAEATEKSVKNIADETGTSPAGNCPSTEYGIAVAIPGPFDYGKGVFLMKHKFASVYGENFRSLAGIPDSIAVRYTHDVNIMLEGEMRSGNGHGWSRGALVSLGTGLGFAISIDGELLKKPSGSPLVSIFALPYREGILEDYASKRGFLRTFARLGGEGAETVKDIAELAKNGGSAAEETFRIVGETVAGAIAPILEEYGVECLLFGGQISRSFDLMEKSVRDGLAGVRSLKSITPISDFGNATFNGLRCLFE